MNKIADVLKTERLNRELTQKELASLLGVTQDSISLWEKGKRIPDTNYVITLSRIFGVSTDYLLGLEDDFGARTATTAAPMGDTFTAEERQLIEKYRRLNPACKKLINNTIDTLVTTSTAATEQKKKI